MSRNSETTAPKKASVFGVAGIVMAFLGLAVAIFGPLAFEVKREPPKQLSDVLADTAVKIKERVARKEVKKPTTRQTDWRVVTIILASALGFMGAALGTASWIRREDLRVSGTAVAVGVTTIAFHYLVAAIGLAIACILIGWLLSNLS
jgi:hypothetical protein